MRQTTRRKRLASLFVLFLVLATVAVMTAGEATRAQADGKPAKPTGLTAQADQQGVHLSWDSPAGTDITHYRVLRKATETESRFRPVEANTGSADASYTDTTAAAETRYAYRVQAVNSHGKSKKSRGSRITTPPTATEEEATEPPDQVGSVDASQEAGDGTETRPVTVSWTAVDGATKHQVQRNTGPSGAGESTATDLEADATSHEDTDTAYYTKYWYRVRAGNDAGYGPWSDDAEIRTARQPGTPAPPGGLTAAEDQAGTVVMSWTAPDGDESVDGYRVYRRDIESGNEKELATPDADTTSHSDDTVRPERWYSWWVVAHNSVGDSPSSKMETLKTKVQTGGVPNPPTGLELSEDTAGEVVVSWNAASDGPDATEHRIYRGKVGESNTGIIASVSVGTTSYTDSSAEGEVWYEYYVRAMNLAGDSSAEGPEAIHTKPQTPGVPNRPTSVTATEDNPGEVLVSWTAPSDGDDPTGYKVYRKELNDTGEHALVGTVDAPSVSYTDDTVDGEVWYDYRVRATNSAGDSGESLPETILTQAQTEGAPPAPEDTDASQ